jgi:hypothetical protein
MQVIYVLKRVHDRPLSLQSDFARSFDTEVAALASEGMISTRVSPDRHGDKWRITGIGLDTLRNEGSL